MRQIDVHPPAVLDPRLTLIRSREVGTELYDAVMRRLGQVEREPSGVMFHFSGSFEDQFFVVTAYRNPENASIMFAEFTAPEIGNVVQGDPIGADIGRHEFAITRYAVQDDDDLQGFRFTQPGEFVAVLIVADRISRERYLEVVETARFPEEWPDGLVIHVAGQFGAQWGIFDIWRADADLRSFYEDRIGPAAQLTSPGQPLRADHHRDLISLHSLYIDTTNLGTEREYLREA